MNIGIHLFPHVEELDWAGPWEVLAYWAHQFPGDGVTVFTLAREPGVIVCAKGAKVVPDHTLGDRALDRCARLPRRPGDPHTAG